MVADVYCEGHVEVPSAKVSVNESFTSLAYSRRSSLSVLVSVLGDLPLTLGSYGLPAMMPQTARPLPLGCATL
ncbi:hypothetical protein Pmani_005110 [Petrolisthes manimaculis]|uniref:Uncharacterized protein n=1 Tax=Petrolisthes manimaculis TaxID=1843537 RepID=A0AAE1QCF4_9EUCA|nr:hypothetical protein Pmani_005110 [Petrolisthes manimaculis]